MGNQEYILLNEATRGQEKRQVEQASGQAMLRCLLIGNVRALWGPLKILASASPRGCSVLRGLRGSGSQAAEVPAPVSPAGEVAQDIPHANGE